MAKLVLKKMNVYRLHRNNLLDHKNGRPAILLKYKSAYCLVWAGTSKLDKLTKEQPVIIKLNGETGYFYSTGIEKVNTKDLVGSWSDFQTNKACILSSDIEKKLITKFIEFSNQKNPYKEITLIELNNQVLKQKFEILKEEYQLLKQKNELLKQEKQSEEELEIK